MSVIAECTLMPAAYPLGEAVVVPEGVMVELEQVVPAENGTAPWLWVHGDVDGFVDHLREQPVIERAGVLDRFDDEALVALTWAERPRLVSQIGEAGVTLLSVEGRPEGWLFRVRSPNQERIEELHDYCLEMEMPFELRRISTLSGPDFDLSRGLTDRQRETLVHAVAAGYYDEPRGATLDVLAAEFGVSPRAVSRRLRRATRALVRNTLLVDEEQ